MRDLSSSCRAASICPRMSCCDLRLRSRSGWQFSPAIPSPRGVQAEFMAARCFSASDVPMADARTNASRRADTCSAAVCCDSSARDRWRSSESALRISASVEAEAFTPDRCSAKRALMTACLSGSASLDSSACSAASMLASVSSFCASAMACCPSTKRFCSSAAREMDFCKSSKALAMPRTAFSELVAVMSRRDAAAAFCASVTAVMAAFQAVNAAIRRPMTGRAAATPAKRVATC